MISVLLSGVFTVPSQHSRLVRAKKLPERAHRGNVAVYLIGVMHRSVYSQVSPYHKPTSKASMRVYSAGLFKKDTCDIEPYY